MTFTGCTSVPLDDFLFQENVGLALWGNTSNSSRRSAIRKAALIKEKELEEAPSQIRRAAEDVTYDNDSKVNNSKNTKSRLSSKESDTSDGHTSDGDVSYSTSEGFYYGNYCELDPRELPASSAPDCYPINTRGRGYTTDLLRDDFRIYTRAVLETHVEICDASLHGSISEFARSRVEAGDVSGSFLICNLSTLTAQYNLWRNELPMVEPFYAVKCNPDPSILRVLASLGCGFDCATMGEIDLILNGLGDNLNFCKNSKAAKHIVYANPAKMASHIEFAIDNGVKMTVFDGEDELYKIATLPGSKNMELLLRITTDDSESMCAFSHKFGCPVSEAEPLLKTAQKLELNVVGVSFHVGSGCGDASAYTKALADTTTVFQLGENLGMKPMTIVDIGGGFPGDDTIYGTDRLPDFCELAKTIRKGIDGFFSSMKNRSHDQFRFIAEPGRFFVSASTTIVTKVYSRKGGSDDSQALYVDDGVYGSFNNVVYDHALPVPKKLVKLNDAEADDLIPTAVFGPTCDGLDQMCHFDKTCLPRCKIGDWLFWENQGAYTHTASFVFNGYTHVPNKIYCTL